MGTVTIHAGMMKTGSTSIQSWLRRNAPDLATQHGLHILCDSDPALGRPASVVPFDDHKIAAATAFVVAYSGALLSERADEAASSLSAELCDSISEHATDLGSVLVSSEALATPILGGDSRLLEAIEGLAQRHQVRCVFYVRRQDATLESRWRQWGYQHKLDPAAWVRTQLADLHYFDGLERAEKLAPSVEFVVRPFERALLRGGDVVVDFAHEVLGVTDLDPDNTLDENPAISLDLAMMLRAAPLRLTATPGADKRGFDSGRRLATLGRVAAQWTIDDSPAAIASRQLLQAVAHREFEAGNLDLIDRFGWPTTAFVPALEVDGSIDDLDRLWAVEATPALDYLFAALEQLCLVREGVKR